MVIPLTYLVDALRQVMVNIPGDYSLLINVIVLVIWLLVSFLITVKFWRWE